MLRKSNASRSLPPQTVVIADQTVADLHLGQLLAQIPPDPLVLTFPPGEASKSLDAVRGMYERLAGALIERDAIVVAFGGGVAGDVGGFVAATWLRGVRCIQVPTTLLAAVDASVGGKTGVNLSAGKNLIGAFHQPSAVVIDIDFLQTLPDREFTSGLAESVKQAVVRAPDFLAWHEQHSGDVVGRSWDVVGTMIARNCELKAEIVALDEREADLRAILNHGHTIGHALEHLLEYELRHGECVALGMIVENDLARRRGLLPEAAAHRIRSLLSRLGLPTRLSRGLDPGEIIARCRSDKKVRGGRMNFVLLRDIGQPVRVADVSDDEIRLGFGAIQPACGPVVRGSTAS